MKNHPKYVQLKQIALDNNYTVEQVRELTFNQAAGLLGERGFTSTFLENAKRGIIMAMQDRDDKANLQQLKSKVKTFLDAKFPQWEAERDRDGDKPYVKIYLEGKP